MGWLDQVNPQAHLLWHGRWEHGGGEPARWLHDHELVVVTEGHCEVTIENDVFSCPAGSFIVVPPGRRHSSGAVSEEGVYRYCVHFDWVWQRALRAPIFVFMPHAFDEAAVHQPPAFVPSGVLRGDIDDFERVKGALDTLAFEWRAQQGSSMCRAYLLQVLVQLLAEGERGPAVGWERVLALRVKKLLDVTMSSNESVRERLQQLRFSYEHLCRLFRRHFGVTPVGYLNMLRVERAKSQLKNSDLNISEIANKLGFSSPAYFGRVFRKYTGTSPREFRG